MMVGDAEPANRLAMLLRCVSDIGLPAVAGIARGKPAHDPIARDLSNDGRRGDREAERIAFDHRSHRTCERRSNGAVDECCVRAHSQHRHGARHRQKSRAQNVEAVYLDCARRADPDASAAAIGAPAKRAVAGLALFSSQHLRIVEPVAQHLGESAELENHRGGNHRASQRPSPCLIDPAHQPPTLPLDLKIRHRLSTPAGTCATAPIVSASARGPVGGVAHGREIAILIECSLLLRR